jgi:hypothetical protein
MPAFVVVTTAALVLPLYCSGVEALPPPGPSPPPPPPHAASVPSRSAAAPAEKYRELFIASPEAILLFSLLQTQLGVCRLLLIVYGGILNR